MSAKRLSGRVSFVGTDGELPCQIVFLHIARTGGSTAWWHLAHTYSSQYHIGDIYHESRQRFGTAHDTYRTISTLRPDYDSLIKPLFLHHHTLFPVDRLLSDAKFILFLRDPVDRLVSYYKHNVRFFGDDTTGPYGDIKHLPLLDFARSHPGPRNPLTLYFYNSILYAKAKKPKVVAFEQAVGERKLRWKVFQDEIMPFVEKFFQERVLFVGFQEQFTHSIEEMDAFFDVPRAPVIHERINDSKDVKLLPEDAAKFSAIREKLHSLCIFDSVIHAYAKGWMSHRYGNEKIVSLRHGSQAA